jgi:hypothetical protein
LGDITVTFWGICTYVEAYQRMVLVNASREVIEHHPKLAEHSIDAHHARLHVRVGDVLGIGPLTVHEAGGAEYLRLNLHGVMLAIPNSAEPFLRDNHCLPHLDRDLGADLGPPRPATESGNATMACFFDLNGGKLSGYKTVGGAGINVLTAATEGDPRLVIAPFQGAAPTEITLRSGASVVVTNLPDLGKEADSHWDFLLSYLTADEIPSKATFPEFVDCPPSPFKIDDAGIGLFVSAGCSNSNYP